MTEGERRIYHWIDDRVYRDNDSKQGYERDPSTWRGSHTMVVEYKRPWPICECCGQHVRVDADTAYMMFCESSIKWNGENITHNELRFKLLGIDDGVTDSKGSFRNPASYGIDPFREWGRRELGKNIVLIDLDIAVRRYGDRFGLDSNGDLMLIEKKERWPRND